MLITRIQTGFHEQFGIDIDRVRRSRFTCPSRENAGRIEQLTPSSSPVASGLPCPSLSTKFRRGLPRRDVDARYSGPARDVVLRTSRNKLEWQDAGCAAPPPLCPPCPCSYLFYFFSSRSERALRDPTIIVSRTSASTIREENPNYSSTKGDATCGRFRNAIVENRLNRNNSVTERFVFAIRHIFFLFRFSSCFFFFLFLRFEAYRCTLVSRKPLPE